MIDILLQHRTIRKYNDQPVDDHLLKLILEAGCRASTTGNMQVYSIVVTRDNAMKEKLKTVGINSVIMRSKTPVSK